MRPIAKLALGGMAAVAIALPAISQEAPESLLPPGFGAPAPAPSPGRPAPRDADRTAPGETPSGATSPGETGGRTPLTLPDLATIGETETETGDVERPAIELPDAARRPIDVVGPLAPDKGGLGPQVFGRSNGRHLTVLMQRLDAPVASRWTSILLRRALLSGQPAPSDVAPADWVAERAWLLLRMGEADAARLLVSSVDVDRFSPRLVAVARQVALANADPAGLCPLTTLAARTAANDASWNYARAMCAALSGDSALSSMLLDRGRGRGRRDIDYLLAEKVVGAGTNSRRATTIEWANVERLTSWRFGLAAAVGLEIPDALYETAGRHVVAWRARAPMYAPEDRLGAARAAAALGIFSNAMLVDLYGQAHERQGDVGRDAPAARLRAAYAADGAAARMAAIRSFWTEARGQPGGLYGARILTARAAARIAPDDSFAADYENLMATMLSAGLDRQAARWAPLVESSSPSIGDDAWALLAVGAPEKVVNLAYGRIDGYGARLGAGGGERMRMLIAGLAGLGRISGDEAARLAERYDLDLKRQGRWTRAIERAAARGERGTVALLAAVGMQTGQWRHVPAHHLYHVVAALRTVGDTATARMVAAEALSRL